MPTAHDWRQQIGRWQRAARRWPALHGPLCERALHACHRHWQELAEVPRRVHGSEPRRRLLQRVTQTAGAGAMEDLRERLLAEFWLELRPLLHATGGDPWAQMVRHLCRAYDRALYALAGECGLRRASGAGGIHFLSLDQPLGSPAARGERTLTLGDTLCAPPPPHVDAEFRREVRRALGTWVRQQSREHPQRARAWRAVARAWYAEWHEQCPASEVIRRYAGMLPNAAMYYSRRRAVTLHVAEHLKRAELHQPPVRPVFQHTGGGRYPTDYFAAVAC